MKGKTNTEQAKQLKKAQDETMKYKKEASDAEKKLNHIITKLNKEKRLRRRADAEVTRISKIINDTANLAKAKDKRERRK